MTNRACGRNVRIQPLKSVYRVVAIWALKPQGEHGFTQIEIDQYLPNRCQRQTRWELLAPPRS